MTPARHLGRAVRRRDLRALDRHPPAAERSLAALVTMANRGALAIPLPLLPAISSTSRSNGSRSTPRPTSTDDATAPVVGRSVDRHQLPL